MNNEVAKQTSVSYYVNEIPGRDANELDARFDTIITNPCLEVSRALVSF